ncbi:MULTISPECIES: alpha/beta fold hydrolase [Gordonia]|jgi:3-oxoadipate enol-lactonase|uniref:Hydrolase n=2 Tax=Gordonia alkanivorans TaxID=84096 RepID=W9DLX6_9ACTN|nr:MULTISPECIES: alpha/beta hydrolase [Gordonia]ETA08641.1 hydrolase [Gordonia alkanivorans CGMCC 6845]MDH3005301.1 alpha/beta hydrolase [Gordonia alkanivorans]MDH3010400.1 alpha/beta hydrolase [Gordonia alkanivorans]MDH3014713.1 alpha/beta hydrolase [Gordonia alkanivorans]MDH3019196.1 alpha/beta hydrolase [Gordonia alkanivorans]
MLIPTHPDSTTVLDVEVTGTGEPLLLIAGMSAHREMWTAELLDRLTPHFQVAVYDHRGIGGSSRAEGSFTIADLADDARGVLDGLGWDTAHVLGTSMGGMIAQELTLGHADRVRSLVLGCTTAGGPGAIGTSGALRLVEAIASRDAARVARTAFEVNLSPGFCSDDGAFEKFTKFSTLRKVPSAVVAAQAAACAGHDTRDRLAAIDVPTTVIHGDVDDVIGVAEGERLAAAIPDASLERWAGVGHMFWWERPEQTAEVAIRTAKAAG